MYPIKLRQIPHRNIGDTNPVNENETVIVGIPGGKDEGNISTDTSPRLVTAHNPNVTNVTKYIGGVNEGGQDKILYIGSNVTGHMGKNQTRGVATLHMLRGHPGTLEII